MIPVLEELEEGDARASGTPFISFFTPKEILTLASGGPSRARVDSQAALLRGQKRWSTLSRDEGRVWIASSLERRVKPEV